MLTRSDKNMLAQSDRTCCLNVMYFSVHELVVATSKYGQPRVFHEAI
jgi:hypothetical protein